MDTSTSKLLYFVAILYTTYAIVEGGVIFSNSRKCQKRTGKFPIPGSFCTSYYICKNWIVSGEESCPEDKHFNPNKGYCDFKDSYPCLEKPRRNECPQSNGRFLKNGTDCRSYYDCCDGEPKEKKCSEGLLFDAESGKCDFEELVDCDGSSKNKDCPKPNGKFLKPGTKCKAYFECCQGKAKEKKCNRNQLFNAKSGRCDRKDRVICKEKENKKCPKPNGRFLKSGTECKMYYVCNRGRASEKMCPENQLFDSKKGKCDWEKSVTCKDEESSSESSSSESEESSKESTPVDKSTPPLSSPETKSEDTTTVGMKSSSPITDNPTEEVKSPSPVTVSTSDEVESSPSTVEATSQETSYSTSDSTISDVSYSIPESTKTVSETSPEISSEASTKENISTPLQTTSESYTEEISSTSPWSTPQQTTSESYTEETSSTTPWLTPQQTTNESYTEETSSTSPWLTPQQTTSESYTEELSSTSPWSTPQQTTDELFTNKVFTSSPHLRESTPQQITSASTEKELPTSDPTTESILEPITNETTNDVILRSTYFSTEDPVVYTYEITSRSIQSEEPSSHGSTEATVEEISTKSEETSSNFETTQSSRTDDVIETTTETVNIISSDSTAETISSLATRSEILSSTSVDQTTIDPVLVDFVCPEETGYYPHPNDKHKFIGCVHKKAYIMDCPAKLVYNAEKHKCL